MFPSIIWSKYKANNKYINQFIINQIKLLRGTPGITCIPASYVGGLAFNISDHKYYFPLIHILAPGWSAATKAIFENNIVKW